MLVLEAPESVRLITQHDHARLAQDLLALWTADGLPDLDCRDDLLLATAEHDCGWQGSDAAPVLNHRTGLPFDFRTYPDEDRQFLWMETVDRFAETKPRVALLLLRHAERIHDKRRSEPDWSDFFADLAKKRLLLEESSDSPSSELDDLYESLWLADIMSLGACGALGITTLSWRSYELSLEPSRITLHPFPYAGSLALRVACRLLPRRRYSRAEDLASDLANARWQFMIIRVEPR